MCVCMRAHERANGNVDPERVWSISTVHSVFFQECNHFIFPQYFLFIMLMIMGMF